MNIKPHVDIEKYNNYREIVKNNAQFKEYVKDNNQNYTNRKLSRLTSFCYALEENIDVLIAETDVNKILEMIETFREYKMKYGYTIESTKTEISTIRGFYLFLGVNLPRKNEPINPYYTKDIESSKSFAKFKKQKTREESTLRRYKISLTAYCDFHQMSIDELIEEADKEEEMQVREAKRKIKNRILEFRSYMREKGLGAKTIKSRVVNIKTFYRACSITVPYIDPDTNQLDRQLRYDEIPTKEHIKRALETTSNIRNRAMFLFMATSGSASDETRNVTIKQYMEGTKECHGETTDIKRAIEKMDNNIEFIPVIPMVRGKKKFEYYTCITPEANQFIINYLKTRENLTLEDKLFDINEAGVKYAFSTVNDTNNWGWVKDGRHRFFASHQMRRFNFNVYGIENEKFAYMIQGRKFSTTTEAYYARDPMEIRETYKKFLADLTIYEKYQINTISDEGFEELSKELEEKNKEIQILKNQLEKQKEEQKNRQKEIGDLKNQLEKQAEEHSSRIEEVENEIKNLQPLKHLNNPNPHVLSSDIKNGAIEMGLQVFIHSCNTKTEGLTKLDKKIQSYSFKELEAIKEISYDIAVNDERFKDIFLGIDINQELRYEDTVQMKPIVQKAIAKISRNPQLLKDTVQFLNEKYLNAEKLVKYNRILYYEIDNLGIYEKDEIDDICDIISMIFSHNANKVLMDDITNEFVKADIDKFLKI